MIVDLKKDWCVVSVLPSTSRTVKVKYKNKPPYNSSQFVTEGELFYDVDKDKFLTKFGRNKTNKISYWKDL